MPECLNRRGSGELPVALRTVPHRAIEQAQSMIGEIAARPQSYRGQICVLSLAVLEAAPPLSATFAEVAAGPARIVLVDCLELEALPTSLCDEVAAMHHTLSDQGRQLIVVNASPRAEALLRRANINTAATKDRPLVGEGEHITSDPRLPVAEELTAAIRGRDAALASLEWLEADDDGAADRTDRLLARKDRLAAATDRYAAAVDRLQASIYLEQTRRDNLTGAWQRHAGLDQLRREIDRAHRTQSPLVVAFVDVDHLKAVNDRDGHQAGDGVLQQTGQTLLLGLRSYDLTIRYGGDEFVCVLPHIEIDAATQRLTHLQAELRSGHPAVSVTIGFSCLEPGDTVDDIIGRADRALYRKRASDRTPDAGAAGGPSPQRITPSQRS